MTRRPDTPLHVATLLVVLTPLAGCSVDRAKYEQRVYACDLRATDYSQECGAGWTCHPGYQLGTFDFCAPACSQGDATDYCSPDGAEIATCDPAASGTCAPGMECLRTSLTDSEGLCLPVQVCSTAADCTDPIQSQCLSKVLEDAYGDALGASSFTNLWCLQGDCNDLSPCAAGHSCLGGIPLLQKIPAVCTPNCGRGDLCPRSFVCASEVLASLPYHFCLPGLFGFPCQNDDQCLMGTCQSLGSHAQACTVACTSDAQCEAFYHPAPGGAPAKGSVACIGGQCITAFSVYMQLLCDPGENRCPDDAQCVSTKAAADGGVPQEAAIGDWACYKPCDSPADCKNSGTARSCLKVLGFTSCAPGVPSPAVECDPSDPDACLKGLDCKQPATGRPFCTIACTSDQQCQTNPWLTDAWHCRGPAGNQLCTWP